MHLLEFEISKAKSIKIYLPWYIEISPIYKGFEAEIDDEMGDEIDYEREHEAFDNFLNSYEAIDIVCIDKSVATKWYKECCEIIRIFHINEPRYKRDI